MRMDDFDRSFNRTWRMANVVIFTVFALIAATIVTVVGLAGWAGWQVHKHGLKGTMQQVWEGPATNSAVSNEQCTSRSL